MEQVMQYAPSLIVSILVGGNIFFIKRLIEQQDVMKDALQKLNISVGILTSRLDTIHDEASGIPELKTRVALLERCVEGR